MFLCVCYYSVHLFSFIIFSALIFKGPTIIPVTAHTKIQSLPYIACNLLTFQSTNMF